MDPKQARVDRRACFTGGLSLIALAAVLGGCGGEEAPAPATCPPENVRRGMCVGTPPTPICDGDVCADGVACARVVEAGTDAALAAALAGAAPGDCVALLPGSYSAASLPGGVSLLGASADAVHIAGVTMGAGEGAVVRGLAIGGGGVKVDGATGARIESVRVTDAAGVGIEVAAGAEVTVLTSTVARSGLSNVVLVDGARATVQASLLEGGAASGAWAACSADCACQARPELTLIDAILRGNQIGGVVLFGADAALMRVDILDTRKSQGMGFGQGGGGLSAARCSNVQALGLRVMGSESFGVRIDDSDATLGGALPEEAIEISNNFVGLWVSNVSATAPQAVLLEGATIQENQGVGIGVSGASRGFIICHSAVGGTSLRTLPVYKGGDVGFQQEVGDGLVWSEGSEVDLIDLTLDGNARASVLINGAALGSLQNVTLQGGDEAKGIVQQNYAGGDQPTVGAGTPPLTVLQDEQYEVPIEPDIVARNP